jgi:uncharacterized heparinase superfamily protein
MATTLGSVLYRSPVYRLMLRGEAASDVALVYPSLLLGDPVQGECILAGGFLLAGRRVPFGRMPWSVLPPGRVLAETLHEFGWLGDLRSVGSDAARSRARDLVAGWAAVNRRWSQPAWAPPVLARRLIHWLAAAEFLLGGAEPSFRRTMLAAATMQARHLDRSGSMPPADPAAITIAIGRLAAALALGIGDGAAALQALGRALQAQLLPDGGHIARSPAVQFSVLRDLIDVRAALAAVGKHPPPEVAGAIERMAPVLRALRHGDGRLALFHGAKEHARTAIDTVLVASQSKERAAPMLPDSGFARLAAGRTLIVADVGPPPPVPNAHAGLLAFELSDGEDRLVVNCGAFIGDDPHWRAALRSTAAHSTVTIGETNAAELRPRWWRPARRVAAIGKRRETDGAVWLDARHDGYRHRFGVLHERRLYIDATGGDVRGEDTLSAPGAGAGERAFRVRFHLHPAVEADAGGDGASLQLRSPGGSWKFVCAGGTPSLEESAYLGRSDQPQPTRQIVISGPLAAGARVKWALRRQGGAG